MHLGIYPYYCKLKQESQCAYRPYNCPYAGSECAVIGDIPFLVAHLKDDHKVDTHNGSTFNHRSVKSNPQEVENATWMLTEDDLAGRAQKHQGQPPQGTLQGEFGKNSDWEYGHSLCCYPDQIGWFVVQPTRCSGMNESSAHVMFFGKLGGEANTLCFTFVKHMDKIV